MHGLNLRNVARRFRCEVPAAPRLNKVLQLYCGLAQTDPDTIRRNVRLFRLFVVQTGNIRATAVTRLMATQFQADLRGAGKAKATIRSYCGSVSSVFGWAVSNLDVVTENPFKGPKKPKLDRTQPVFFTRDEMARLYHAIECMDWRDPILRLQWRAMLMVADTCGFRIGEILNIRWDDIEFDPESGPPTIYIQYRPHTLGQCWEWGTKGHRDRSMPIDDDRERSRKNWRRFTDCRLEM